MTDLHKAAEMALEALNYHFDNEDDYLNWKYPLVLEAKEALRQALAQPEWVGLTDEEIDVLKECSGCCDVSIRKAEAKLKEKNCYE
jgi:hypothetical protein